MKKTLLFLGLLLAFSTNSWSQFTQNFDSGTTTPAGWGVINGGDTNTWTIGPPALGTAHSASNVAQIIYSATAHNDYLVSPQINVVGGVNERVTFWILSVNASYPEHFNVKLSTTTPTVAGLTTTLIPDTAAPNTWSKITINLSAYVGQSIYIGIHSTSSDMFRLYVDDFVNDTAVPMPFSENFDALSSLPAEWNIVNGVSTSTYTWTFGPTGISSVLPHSGTRVAKMNNGSDYIVSDDYLVTPQILITPGINDRVSFWVRKVYSYNTGFEVKVSTAAIPTEQNFNVTLLKDVALSSEWAKITLDLTRFSGQNVFIGFHSTGNQYLSMIDDFVCDAMPQSPGFPQGFETSDTIPSSWQTINTSGASSWTVSQLGTNAFGGTNAAKFNYTGTTTQNDLLVTSQINVVAGVNDRLSFWVKNGGNSSARYMGLKVSTTNTSLSSFTNLNGNSSGITAYGYWELRTFDLTQYVGQSIYLGFTSSETSATTFYIDDISVERRIPSLTTDCHGIVDLSTHIPTLLNGLDPAIHTVSFFSAYSNAQSNQNPLDALFNYGLSSQNFLIYARIFNTQTSTFTINYFAVLNGKVSFSFLANDYQISLNNLSANNPNYTLQWYRNEAMIATPPNNILYTFGQIDSYRVVYTDTSGCSETSDSVNTFPLNPDFFTVNLSNGVSAITPSILNNEVFIQPGQNVFFNLNGAPSGFTINQDGTINIPVGTAPGTYNMTCDINYFSNSQNTFINYNLLQMVTIIVPVNGIRMNAFIDNNNNGIKDIGEVNFPKGKFKYIVNNDNINNVIISPVGSCTVYDTGFTNSYDLSYEIDTEFLSNYSFANISFNDITITGNGIQEYNFPITITNNYNDLSITNVPLGSPRPGFQYGNKIAYSNNGTQTVSSGTVSYTKGNGVTITNVSESGIVSNTNGFTFNFTNLLPFETRYITIDLLTATIPTVTLGQLVSNSASITVVANDVLPLNNSSVLNQSIVGSYDPNSKSEGYGGKIVYSSFTADDYLTYTIQFENTGTGYATFINLTDVLDTKLDENSIRMLDASHVYTLKRIGSNLNWNFANINLPPSVADTSIGKGYVTFKIKPKQGYAVGDIIPNSANIYFDYNPAITTTVCTTEFVSILNTEDFTFNDLQYFPNPVKNTLSISNSYMMNQVEITSVLGQKLMTKNLNDLQTELDLSSLPNGIYFVKVNADQVEKIFRIIKK